MTIDQCRNHLGMWRNVHHLVKWALHNTLNLGTASFKSIGLTCID